MLFHNLNSNGKWLKLPPPEWEEDGNYLKMKLFNKTVKVTKDAVSATLAELRNSYKSLVNTHPGM